MTRGSQVIMYLEQQQTQDATDVEVPDVSGMSIVEASRLTDDESLLIEYARAIANDHKHIPDDLLQRLLDRLGEEGLVVLTTMAMFMIGNNYFNDILRVQSEFLQSK